GPELKHVALDVGADLVIYVAHQIRTPLGSAVVEPSFDLRPGSLACAGRRVRAVIVAPGAAEQSQLQPRRRSRRRRAERLHKPHLGEPPADESARPVPQWEGDVGRRNRDVAEQQVPVLADAERGAAVREVGVREAEPGLWLLIAVGADSGERAEEVELRGGVAVPPLADLGAGG